MSIYLIFIFIALFSYLMGGVNGAIIASKCFFKKDIREYGSGNAGLTNFYRVFNKTGVLLVLTIDVLKTLIPVLLGGFLMEQFYQMWAVGGMSAGLFAMLGHVFPVYYKFKGGKAVLAAGTLAAAIDWRVGVILWGLFLLLVLITRYVSLGSVVAGAAFPFAMWAFGYGAIEIACAALGGFLLLMMHRGNIARLAQGTETKLNFKFGGKR